MTDSTTPRRKPGRQRLDPSLRKKAMLSFAASDSERDAIHEHVARLGLGVSEWLRAVAFDALKNQTPKEPA